MGKNTHFKSETILQIVTLYAVDQTKEIIDLVGVSHTSVWIVYPSSFIQRFTVLRDTSSNTLLLYSFILLL